MKTIYTFYADAARIALQSILAHKLRAFLTLIGIIIGVASVVVVGAAISGLNTYVMEKVTAMLGVNHFMIARMAHQGESERGRVGEDEPPQQACWNWKTTSGCATTASPARRSARSSRTRTDLKQDGEELFGVSASACTRQHGRPSRTRPSRDGRFFQPRRCETAAMVVVLGDDVKEKFFPGQRCHRQDAQGARAPDAASSASRSKRGSMFGDSRSTSTSTSR